MIYHRDTETQRKTKHKEDILAFFLKNLCVSVSLW